ncbi:MAG: methionyl-tRNA formyltransferase [Calditrichaeota bacterium]|nr:MAG: methionyl-tRNA formyltransferase [Calditrichota bacterium]MBL1204249.1 methionyl-tRNA formyltransferase [Calditrichota bacterium]NOG44079.1 methionyl-tRNA formyltransferase [Calditrichota bacterium]
MKIVFMGTPDFAVESLKALIKSSHEVCAVVTIPDKKQGRGLKIKSSPVKQFAEKYHISVLQPESFKDSDFIEQLRNYSTDCFVVVAFKILPKEIFTIPKLGTVNVHGSLLPAYRGAAPINWAIMNGDLESGVTTMLIDSKVDTGDMLLQDKTIISENMTAGELHDILAEKGAALLVQSLDKLAAGVINPIAQDNTKATKAPKINNLTALIDLEKPARDVHNQIRGLSPYPGAYSFVNDKKIKLLQSEVIISPKKESAGKIIEVTDKSFSIACENNAIKILQVQLEGKRKMTSRDFLNGYKLTVGDCFKIIKP